MGVNFPRRNVSTLLLVRHSPHITKTILEGGLGAALLVLSHDHGLRHFWPLGWTSGWRGDSCAYWIHKVDLESDDRGMPTLMIIIVVLKDDCSSQAPQGDARSCLVAKCRSGATHLG